MDEETLFTAIYVDSWMSGGHRRSLTKMRRITRLPDETVGDMLQREGIAESTNYLFKGHPPLQGEQP